VAALLLGLRVRFPPEHEYLFVVSVVCFQVEISATDPFLVHRSPTDMCVCVIDCDKVKQSPCTPSMNR
jgi:hypothetical protein